MWGGLGAAPSSEASVRPAGAPLADGDADFGALILLGVRIEAYPGGRGPGAGRVGVAVEVAGLAGEADVRTQPGLPREEVTLTAGVVTPSLLLRASGRAWQLHVGAGPTILWGSRLSGAGGFTFDDDDTDVEAPLGLAVIAGVQRVHPGRWFLLIEGRYQAGRNDFELRAPRTEVGVDWRTFQVAFGSGYRF
jgi:opacity protein-like surface antigen